MPAAIKGPALIRMATSWHSLSMRLAQLPEQIATLAAAAAASTFPACRLAECCCSWRTNLPRVSKKSRFRAPLGPGQRPTICSAMGPSPTVDRVWHLAECLFPPRARAIEQVRVAFGQETIVMPFDHRRACPSHSAITGTLSPCSISLVAK